jgi:low affinity Fe/Cu permease
MSSRLIKTSRHTGFFARFAREVAYLSGHPLTFAIAVLVLVAWGVSGFFVDFSDTWQLVINTGTTIVTFLMVFLIQNTQNKDTNALQIKIDELIRVTKGAHYALMAIENLTDKEIDAILRRYAELAEKGRRKLREGARDTGAPYLDVTIELAERE